MNRQPNIILIVVDTLRSDSVLDKATRKPLLKSILINPEDWNIFYDCVSPSSWTIPSHASIFTGVYPSRNGVIEDIDHKLPDYNFLYSSYSGTNLAEYLKKSGYCTYSFSQNNLVGVDSAFARGFDSVSYSRNPFQETYSKMHDTLNKIYDNWGGSPKEEITKSLRKLDTFSLMKEYYTLKAISRKIERMDMRKKGARELLINLQNTKINEPFYLFINLMEMHDPHDRFSLSIGWQDTVFGNNSYDKKEIANLKAAYLGALSEVDSFLMELFAWLKNKKMYENTEIIITSDHGQSLFEDSYFGHCNFLYDSIIDVPLFIKLPDNKRISVQPGYQSTTRIFQFIRDGIEDGIFHDSISVDAAFSECNGFFDPIVKKYRGTDGFEEIYERYNIPTKAIFKNGYKLVYDFKNFKILEFKKQGKKIDPEDAIQDRDSLLEDLSIFSNVSL